MPTPVPPERSQREEQIALRFVWPFREKILYEGTDAAAWSYFGLHAATEALGGISKSRSFVAREKEDHGSGTHDTHLVRVCAEELHWGSEMPLSLCSTVASAQQRCSDSSCVSTSLQRNVTLLRSFPEAGVHQQKLAWPAHVLLWCGIIRHSGGRCEVSLSGNWWQM